MKLTRRRFVDLLGGATIGILTPRSALGQDEAGPNELAGVRLEPFVDPLRVPPLLKAPSARANSQHHVLNLSEFRQKLHRDLPETVLWGFQGSTPGPTILARRGRMVTIQWVNRLPHQHRLAVDHTIMGAEKEVPEVRTTVHLHGGHVAPDSDGYPEDWIVPGSEQKTVYPNQQAGATLWYHDHAMGITRLNTMMGLVGFYILEDPHERELRLPSGGCDIPLVIQDRSLDARGQLIYPIGPTAEAPWVPEFFGTQILVNGRVSPYLDVEPRMYRLRFLNASNARIFQLSLTPGQPFIQIGSDGGLLCEPIERDDFLISPGERVDALIDFRGREGRKIMLINDAPAPYPSGGGPIPRLVMQFRVQRPLRAEADANEIPAKLADVSRLQEKTATKIRRLVLREVMTGKGPHQMLLNGSRFMDPITEDPVNGSVEIWELVNTTIDAHPIHLHAVHFQLLSRQPFDVRLEKRTSEIVISDTFIAAAPEERGWKDTILCPPGQITRIITPFHGTPGRYVWHCHTLEHEDNEMMRPYLLRG